MKRKKVKKLLLVSALSLSMAYAITGCSENDKVANPVDMAAAAQTHRLTKASLENWIQGLRVAFPLYRIELKSYEDQGADRSLATIAVSMGHPGKESSASDNFYVESLIKLDIEHGYKLENGIQSVARINYEIDIQETSTSELLRAFHKLEELMASVKHDSVWVVKPDGEFYMSSKSTEPFERNDEKTRLVIPSFASTLETYDNKRLLRFQIEIPTIEVDGVDDKQIHFSGIRAQNKDRTIRDGVYQLNVKADVSVDKVDVSEDGKNLALLNNIHYTENANVDANGLLHSEFTVSFSGQETASMQMGNRNTSGTTFDFATKGYIHNFHANSYIEINNALINDFEDLPQNENLESMTKELLAYEPEFNLEKMSITINGHQGEAVFKASLPQFSDSDKTLSLTLLLLSKLEAQGNARIPVEWFELVEPDRQKREEVIVGLLMSGYIERQGNYLASSFSYKGGEMKVNGQPLKMF